MKTGGLVRWAPDGDVGIVIGIVGDDGEGSTWDDGNEAGNPIISWFGLGLFGADSSVRSHDKDLEVINESR
jgi:hypothetical protein